MAENPLKDKIVWITGAGRGIGRAIALAVAAHDAKVALSARTAGEIESVANEISHQNSEGIAIVCDVEKAADIAAAVSSIGDKWGAVDILINNAGTAVFRKIIDTSESDWETIMATNLRGAFLCCKAVLPDMIARRSGHIINVVSVAGRQPYSNCGAYCASKYGLAGFTEVLRMETRQHNIRVTALLPGATDTAIWLGTKADRHVMLQPERVAETVVALLCAGDSAMIEEVVVRPIKGDLT